ncbi:hypothetical protein T4C_11917 [Trichinella pseudospiralis]|uniref:Uncharacterized protein n=1 Tax=Trichinella pseudospiralis TaxID=6337 RepID=A0A0V1GG86_TRIPS|nr:hypothetical protein T4C_11917 [Trichinella pseudospiralis]
MELTKDSQPRVNHPVPPHFSLASPPFIPGAKCHPRAEYRPGAPILFSSPLLYPAWDARG